MGALFSSPKIPEMPTPPPVPTVDDAREGQQAKDKLRRRRGMAATILTSNEGVKGMTSGNSVLGG